MNLPPVSYNDYLAVPQLIGLQNCRSEAVGRPAHDEMLFIITHQTYELWFKQILFEIDSIFGLFGQTSVPEIEMGKIVSRLGRIGEIQRVLAAQIGVLETMTPLDFLEFRDLLFPASGFQSAQFRLLENKLGLRAEMRLSYNQCRYSQSLAPSEQEVVLAAEEAPSLFDLVERWLERTPFLQAGGFDFWQNYQQAVINMLERDKHVVRENQQLGEAERTANLAHIEQLEASFGQLFDESAYEDLRKQGLWRLSYRALHAALFIQLYRDQPALQLPHRLLTSLLDVDEQLTAWRYRHAQMALRMLGTKIGTGGSSGHRYLKAATDQHKVFSDLFNLATYYIPRSELPELPGQLRSMLNYSFTAFT